MKRQSKKGIISQLIGMVIVISGVLGEIIFRGHIGFAAITAGAVVWATGAWIKTK